MASPLDLECLSTISLQSVNRVLPCTVRLITVIYKHNLIKPPDILQQHTVPQPMCLGEMF